ncbi:MAG: tRNA 2-thiocytidine biosynthesis protein TtcA [Clostridiales bacterium]|nr:tRNA 2-thiocytidine biosynthesis protein TtcA [Clostridiales bacterium]
MEKHEAVQNSIIKKFRKRIWRKFICSLQDYELVQEGDKIAVCMSGGKDSMLMAKCLQELQLHSHVRFCLEYLVMDPGYSKRNRQLIEENCELLKIPITVFETDIYNSVSNVKNGSCYLCARMRRGHLYKKAQELGCNKIALGHHYDDVIETILLSMFYGAEIKTMMPKLKSTSHPGMELIRPLYLVREESIIAWRNFHELSFIHCACRLTENCSIDGGGLKRPEIKQIIKDLGKLSPLIEKNIFKSVENVHLDAIIGYRKNSVKHTFLESYDEET